MNVNCRRASATLFQFSKEQAHWLTSNRSFSMLPRGIEHRKWFAMSSPLSCRCLVPSFPTPTCPPTFSGQVFSRLQVRAPFTATPTYPWYIMESWHSFFPPFCLWFCIAHCPFQWWSAMFGRALICHATLYNMMLWHVINIIIRDSCLWIILIVCKRATLLNQQISSR